MPTPVPLESLGASTSISRDGCVSLEFQGGVMPQWTPNQCHEVSRKALQRGLNSREGASGDRIGAKTQPPLCANVLKCPQYHPTGFLGSQSFLSSSRSAVSSQAPPQYGYSA